MAKNKIELWNSIVFTRENEDRGVVARLQVMRNISRISKSWMAAKMLDVNYCC